MPHETWSTDVTASDAGPDALRPELLLLEDDHALCQMLDWELSELGYRVHPAGSCREARAVAQALPIDLALMDVGLPDGDGAELAGELIEARPAMQIVLCSGRPDSVAPALVPTEVIACLTKPVCVGRLDELFRAALDVRKAAP
jgi:DNA-binding response OmpR family regulator